MNSTLFNPAKTDLDVECITVDTIPEDQYATVPIKAVRTFCQDNEEELHTSFEEAISDRVLAVNKQLRRLSGSLINTGPLQPQTDALVTHSDHPRSSFLGGLWQRGILIAGLALMLLMVGFDLMGLLVLHLR